MKRIVALAAACIATVTFNATARAADPAWPVEPPREPQLVEYMSGWYVRGDIGYRYNSIGSVNTLPAVNGYNYANAFSFGGGAGYKWNWIRTDVTLDYGLRGRFDANTAGATGYYRAQIDGFSVLANVYADLGTWGGFTPYIGAGIGGSRSRVTDLQISTPLFSAVAPRDQWNLSWALMAGISYQLTSSLLLDVGYRYLNLGETGYDSGRFTNAITFKDLTAQEVRVGLRLLID